MNKASNCLTRRNFLLASLFLGSLLSTKRWGLKEQSAIAQATPPIPPQPPAPEMNWADPYSARIIRGNNTFALDLFRKLVRDQSSDPETQSSNLFFCPYSVLTALVMAYAGSREQTARQMSETLHFPESDPELHTVFVQLAQTLERKSEQYHLTAANKFWMRDGFEAGADYLNLLSQFYQSDMGRFRDEFDLQNKANTWCAEKTKQRIPEIFRDPPNMNTEFVLANAVYFKAAWLEPFDTEKTQPGPFHLQNGASVLTEMMFGMKETFAYKKFNQHNAEVIELPYEGVDADQWSTTSMAIILPEPGIDIQTFSQTLTYELIQELLSMEDEDNLSMNEFMGLVGSKLHLTMPKLKVTSLFSMRSALCGVGMTDIFSEPDANLSGIHPAAYLIDAQHAAFLEVNEKFTAAAGVTALSGGKRGGRLFKVTVDRPFILLILDASTRASQWDKTTKTASKSDRSILFVGRILNPNESVAEVSGLESCEVDPDFQ